MNIMRLQTLLAQEGLYKDAIDSMTGPKTKAAVEAFLTRNRIDMSGWNDKRKQIAAMQQFCAKVGINPGPIDGFKGPQTSYAFEVYDRVYSQGLPEDFWRDDEPLRQEWPHQRDVSEYYGPVGKNQVMLELPFPMYLAWDVSTVVRRISIHEKVCDSAARALKNIKDHYGQQNLHSLRLDLFGGCLNVRKMRGGSSWSMHSWGIAIDFDPSRNKLRWGRDKAALARPEYIPFWEIWEAEGWVSLGRARNYDWMHVQAARI